MPRAASSSASSCKVKGPDRIRSRSHPAVAPDSPLVLWPPTWPGFKAPVSRCSFRQVETQDGPIESAALIARIVAPGSAITSARSRRSSEQGGVIHAGPAPRHEP